MLNPANVGEQLLFLLLKTSAPKGGVQCFSPGHSSTHGQKRAGLAVGKTAGLAQCGFDYFISYTLNDTIMFLLHSRL